MSPPPPPTITAAKASSSKYYGQYLVEKTTRDEQQKRIEQLEAEVTRLRNELREERDSHKSMLMELARNNTQTSQRHLEMLQGFHKDVTVAQQGHVRSVTNHNQQLGFLLLNQLHQQQGMVENVAIKNSMAMLPQSLPSLTRKSVMEQTQLALPAPKDESEWNRALAVVEQQMQAQRTDALVKDLNETVGKSPENGMKQLILLDAQIKDCTKQIDEAKRAMSSAAPSESNRDVLHKFHETVQEAEDILQALLSKRHLLSDGLRRLTGGSAGGGSGGGGSVTSTALSIRLV